VFAKHGDATDHRKLLIVQIEAIFSWSLSRQIQMVKNLSAAAAP
jgi:hypothetical protein